MLSQMDVSHLFFWLSSSPLYIYIIYTHHIFFTQSYIEGQVENIMLRDTSQAKKQGAHDFTHLRNMKVKATNRQTKTHRYRQQCGGYQKKGSRGISKE